jgi:hypothetical protein
MPEGFKIDSFTEQSGGGDNIKHNTCEALEQMEVYGDIQAPYDITQD